MAGLYLTALYNFAITGSVRPDALFLAWGPGGVTSARVGQGVLGLLLDARYGIVPYVPILLLAAGGLALGGARRFAVVMPAAAVYYLTVASADNWAGAVCNLGRYFMPVAPLAVALVGIAIDRVPPARGALALVLMLAAWTGLFAVALWRDPHAANDSALLLAKSAYADGHQYIPDLFIRRWSDGAPGLWARVAVWLAGLGAVAWWLKRVAASSRRGRGPPRRLAPAHPRGGGRAGARRRPAPRAVAGNAEGTGLPRGDADQGRGARRHTDQTLAAPPVVFVSGAASVREDEAILGPGLVELLLRAPAPGLEPEGHGRRPGERPAGDRPPAARPAPDRGAPRFAACPIP